MSQQVTIQFKWIVSLLYAVRKAEFSFDRLFLGFWQEMLM